MVIGIEHDPNAGRFVALLPRGRAVLAYRMQGPSVMNILSTYVPEHARGHGVGGALVEAALGHARANDWRVIPTCWFVGTWVSQHPEFESVIDG